MSKSVIIKVTHNLPNRMNILSEMERQFDHRNAKYFLDLLTHTDNVIRTRAICILADVAGEDAVDDISNVLRSDKDPAG